MYEIKENSIELWAIETEKLFKNDQQPMDDELSHAFVTCCMNEEKMETDWELKEALEKNKLAYSSVFYNRVRCCQSFEASIALCVLMGMASNSFGEVTIYANYLQYQAHKHNQKRLDIKFVSTYVFPMGFPSKGTLQKVGTCKRWKERMPVVRTTFSIMPVARNQFRFNANQSTRSIL